MEGSTPENSSASSTNKTAETKITKNGNTEIEITVTTTIETEITGTTIAEDEIPKNEIPETETLKETPENIPNIANKLREAQIVFVIGTPQMISLTPYSGSQILTCKLQAVQV